MDTKKTLVLAKLALVATSKGVLDVNTIHEVNAMATEVIAKGGDSETIYAEIAAIPILYYIERYWDDGSALQVFREMYIALGLDVAYCPIDIMEIIIEYLVIKGIGGEDTTVRVRNAYEAAKKAPGKRLKISVFYSIIAFIVAAGLHMRYPELLNSVLTDFEAIPVEVRQEALSSWPSFIRGV